MQRGTSIEVRVTANAFLRRMVRSIVALLIEAGRGRLDPDAVDALLKTGDRALDGRAAPARGLTLERVIYPKNDGGPSAARGSASDARQSTATETKEQES